MTEKLIAINQQYREEKKQVGQTLARTAQLERLVDLNVEEGFVDDALFGKWRLMVYRDTADEVVL